MDTLTAPLGHNSPPDPIAILQAQLAQTHEPLIERAQQLAAMSERLPASCDDDDTAQKLADGIKACTHFEKNSEAARVSAKEPHLAAGRAVDGWFKKLADPVGSVKARMASLLTTYQRKKEAEERERLRAAAAAAEAARKEEERRRREAEAAARKAQEEADRLAREAAKSKADADAAAKAQAAAEAAAAAAREQAAQAAIAREEATAAKTDATAKPAELTRTRSDLGSVASLRRTWEYEVIDDQAIPRMFLTVDHAAIKAFIKSSTDKKSGECKAKIPGVRIFEQHNTMVR
jgi:septal ring factor EnvC (AmiA/AmiB activator)